MAFEKQRTAPAHSAREDSTECLAREIYVAMLGSQYWQSSTTAHKALEAIDAAEMFARVWNTKQTGGVA